MDQIKREGCGGWSKTKSNSVLYSCFKVFITFGNFVGILPLTFSPDGSILFQLRSKRLLHYLAFSSIYLAFSGYYVPIYHRFLLPLKAHNKIDYYSKVAFALGLYASSLISTLLVIPISSSFTPMWNQIHLVSSFLSTAAGYFPMFEKPFRYGRYSFGAFIGCSISFGVIACFYLNPFPQIFSPLEWLEMFGFFLFTSICMIHFFHSLVFIYIAALLTFCFNLLRKYASELGSPPSMMMKEPSASVKQLALVLRHFKSLNESVGKLGACFGTYLVANVLAMLIATIMCVLSILARSTFRVNGFSLGMSYLCIASYLFWIFVLCEAGERISTSVEKCQNSIRDSLAVGVHWKNERLLHVLNGLKPAKLSASNYFVVRRRLIASIFGTFATYAMILIQFRFNNVEDIL